MTLIGKPIQIVAITDSDKRYALQPEVIERIFCNPQIAKKKVALISVAGAFRKGKSFLLDYFLRYLSRREEKDWIGDHREPLKGFSWRSGSERETTGIWIWDTPFLEKLPNGEEIAIFLMDTQGTFDTESTVRDNATIFGLSTLISSVQIYNISQAIQEDDLQHLHLFTEYGQLAAQGEMGADTSCKAFQRLLCLVRDWSFKDFKPGSEGGQLYLDKILKVTDKQHRDLKSVREHVHASFESLNCFLLPHPGLEAVETEDYDGSAHLLRENFREQLSKLVEYTLKPEYLVVKKINGIEITCKEIFKYFSIYIKMYQDPSALPEPKTALQATAEANNVSAKERSINHYNKEMTIACSGRYMAKKKNLMYCTLKKDKNLLNFSTILKNLVGKITPTNIEKNY
jgi:atlastin